MRPVELAINLKSAKALGLDAPVDAVPEVPTLQEAGLKDLDLSYWNGIFAPVGTPSDVIATFDREVGELIGDNELIERFNSAGLEPAYLPHDQMDSFVRSELAHWGEFVRQAGIEPN
jgi:tripartite-type tricarboxylate transporter receptor subunit TctC